PSVPKRLSPPKPQASARVEKAKILEGYKIKDASAHNWQDESSRKAEERLKEKGIQLPWHYNDTFGEDFKVLALRAGGLGAVFFVKSTRFGERIYAAKTLQRFLQKDYLEMPTYQQKKIADDFLEEALPWLEMGQHPNIVPVHLLENIVHPTTKRNVPFVFSEFMEGGDLRNLLVEKGRLNLEEALSVALQICEALIHTYKHGLSAHKDLKPDNIMVYRDGVYKVTDFSTGVFGTPGYMAPEQVASYFGLKENINIDHRADQFATGIILLELILGEHPFPWIRAVYSKEEAEKFVREELKIPDNLPGSLRAVIERCLLPEPDNRFPDISALKEALLDVYRTESGREHRFPEVEIDDSPEWWYNRGKAFSRLGRSIDAEIPYKEALRRFEAMPGTKLDQAGCLMNLGVVYWSKGNLLEAENYLRKAIRMFKEKSGTEIKQARCLVNLGNVYMGTGKLNDAEASHKEALRMYEAIPGTELDQAVCLTNLGIIYSNTEMLSEAEDNYTEALRIFKAMLGTELDQARCLINLGNVYDSTGKFNDAVANYREALRLSEAIPGTEIEQATCLMNLGTVYGRMGKFNDAEANYKEALRMYKAIEGTDIEQAKCLTGLGILYGIIQEYSKARSVLKEAIEICERYPQCTEEIKNTCLKVLGQIP
ncbi:MAG TPA: serine/threonine protein kinase, partial [Desulfobacteraceae bacterium]|nr:serine/threonine protein kinase [Desulfobacteraceae bacterium]